MSITRPTLATLLLVAAAATGHLRAQTSEFTGTVRLEAEAYTDRVTRNAGGTVNYLWQRSTDLADFTGSGFVRSQSEDGTSSAAVPANLVATSPELRYTINFNNPGTYYLWLRGYATTAANDSVYVGLNNTSPVPARITLPITGAWSWSKGTDAAAVAITVPAAGTYTLSLWMAESGFALDRLILTLNPNYDPNPVASAAQFWRNQSIYQVITDRFSDGDPSNNNVYGGYDPAATNKTHGGDWRGLESKLDYIKALGATAVWFSPVVKNGGGDFDYHGYAATDFYNVDPRFGSLQDLQRLVAEAHRRGLLVVNDVVVNHGSTWVDGAGDPDWTNNYNASDVTLPTNTLANFKYPDGYNLQYHPGLGTNTYAAPFDPTSISSAFGDTNLTNIFHNHGVIYFSANGSDTTEEIEKGELFGLDDFRTDTPYVRERMKEIYSYWLNTVGFDAFRLDAVKHVEMGFWNEWSPAMRAAAQSADRPYFFQFGEVLDGNNEKVGSYTGTNSGGSYKLDSVVDYPLFYAMTNVFKEVPGPTRGLEDRYASLTANDYDPAALDSLVLNLDNHDKSRLLYRLGNTNQASAPTTDQTKMLQVALTYLYTSRGIPSLFYGTEQDFNGGSSPGCREDMFDGQFEGGPSEGDNFDMTHPRFQWVAKLNNLRRLYPALRTGSHDNLWAADAAGLFAYARRLGDQEAFVVFNTADSAQSIPVDNALPTIRPRGTRLVNVLNPAETVTTAFAFADSPANYSAWTNASTGGYGFGPWLLAATGTAGNFLATSENNMNVGTAKGFGLYANTGGSATATRDFNRPLEQGDSFTLKFDNNSVENAGQVGFSLTDANGAVRLRFYFVGGQTNYRLADQSDVQTGIPYTASGLTVTVTLGANNSYTLQAGGSSVTRTLGSGNAISRLIVANTGAGGANGGPSFNLYVGEMSVTGGDSYIQVAPRTAAIFVAESQVQALDPVVTSVTPEHDGVAAAGAPITLTFDRAMDAASVEAAFTTTPASTGTFTWNEATNQVTYTPSAFPVTNGIITVRLGDSAKAADGMSLHAPFESRLRTDTGAIGRPSIVSASASGIGDTNAALQASVNPNGAATTVSFAYGPTTGFGTTNLFPIGAGTSIVALTNLLTGLTPDTLYYYRVRATNSAGATEDSIRSFATAAPQPVITAPSATGVGSSEATLSANVDPKGGDATFWFEYGTGEAFESSTAVSSVAAAGGATSVSIPVPGLVYGQTYRFRAVAQNNFGRTTGQTGQFTTAFIPPAANTSHLANATTNAATLSGTVNPHGTATAYWFEYGANGVFTDTVWLAESVAGDNAEDYTFSFGYAAESSGSEANENRGSGFGPFVRYGGTGGMYIDGGDRRIDGAKSFGIYAGTAGHAARRALHQPRSSGELRFSVRLDINNEAGYAGFNLKSADGADFGHAELLSIVMAPGSGNTALLVTDASGPHSIGLGQDLLGQILDVRVLFDTRAGTYTCGLKLRSGGAYTTWRGNLKFHGADVNFAYLGYANFCGGDTQNMLLDSIDCRPVTSGRDALLLSTGVAGLEAGRVYQYRLVADNVLGTTYGETRTFVTGPDLVLSKTAAGSMPVGGTGQLTLAVSNQGWGSSQGLVTVQVTPPAGLTVQSMSSGAGWSFNAADGTLTRSDVLAAGMSYPPVTLSVAIAPNAAAPAVLNSSATVSGGGDASIGNNTASAQVSIRPAIGSLENWRHQHFQTYADEGPAADTNVVTDDGLPNLMKYAMGLNPKIETPAAQQPGLANTPGLSVLFRRAKAADDVVIEVQASDDLSSGVWTNIWSSATNAYGGGTNPFETITVTDPKPVGDVSSGRFLRLNVFRP